MLNLDVSPEHARALHRVVRAMHDGNCPKCGHLGPSEKFYLPEEREYVGFPDSFNRPGQHKCPNCGFTILDTESDAAMQAFRPYMLANLEVFENWRSENAESR